MLLPETEPPGVIVFVPRMKREEDTVAELPRTVLKVQFNWPLRGISKKNPDFNDYAKIKTCRFIDFRASGFYQ